MRDYEGALLAGYTAENIEQEHREREVMSRFWLHVECCPDCNMNRGEYCPRANAIIQHAI